MRKISSIFLTLMCLTGCRTKQWNLNKSIGWDSDDTQYKIIYTKLATNPKDSSLQIAKTRLDSAILNYLEVNRKGEQAENEDSTDASMHFVIVTDYDKTIDSIVTIAKTRNMARDINVVERVYKSFNSWTDKTVYVGKR
jgi:hypothetical protein